MRARVSHILIQITEEPESLKNEVQVSWGENTEARRRIKLSASAARKSG